MTATLALVALIVPLTVALTIAARPLWTRTVRRMAVYSRLARAKTHARRKATRLARFARHAYSQANEAAHHGDGPTFRRMLRASFAASQPNA